MKKIRGKSAKKNFLVVFAIILLCIYPLYATAEVRTFSHEEEIDYGPTVIPRVWGSKVYDDGTIILRIVRENANKSTETRLCLYEILSLRIIHPDGTVDEKDFELDIQKFNYCLPSNAPTSPIEIYIRQDESSDSLEFLDYHLIRKNHILITYYNATDPNDIYSYEEWGMIIDLDGNVLDRTPFGFAFINETERQLTPISKIRLNINREKGFLRLAAMRNLDDAVNVEMEWQQYEVEPEGKFVKLTSGTLGFGNFSSLTGIIISTVDEGYAIVYANMTNNFITTTDSLSPQGQLSVLPIRYNQTSVPPLLLYQNPLPDSTFLGLSCDIAFAEVGHVCSLAVSQTDPAGLSPDETFYVKVNFLSSGSVTNLTVTNLDRMIPNIPIDENIDYTWIINNLPFGGYLLTRFYFTSDSIFQPLFIYGYLSVNDTYYTPWEFPEPTITNGLFSILYNNTLIVVQMQTNNSWQFKAIDLPRFLSDKDNGYFNINVKATFPEIESSINPNIPKISIDFYNPVELSSGSLSIYQAVDDRQYLRQSIPGELCSIENGGKTVSADVFESTFSVSEGNYFIKVDNDFVRDKALNESLLGIRENVWRFITEEKKDAFTPSATGFLRLTFEGTQVIENLSRDERRDLYSNLLEELSVAVPVRLERLTAIEKTQLDSGSNEKRYLISIRINATTSDKYDNSVESIFRIIDTMVRHKDQTPIGSGNVTRYLDESYGFIQSPDLLETYKKKLIGSFLAAGLLLIALFFLAERRTYLLKKKDSLKRKESLKKKNSLRKRNSLRRRNLLKKKNPTKNYNNFAVLQLGVIIFNLVMNLLFVINSARNVAVLYIPSVVCFIMPIVMNMALALYIITQENIKPKFYQWLIENGNVAGVFTVLACVDIEALDILQSNLAGFQSFNAPFSDSAKSKMFWGNFLNIFLKDVPQIIIQVFYRYDTVTYDDIVPSLTLISSTVNLVANIIALLYKATHRVTIPEYIPNLPDGIDNFLVSNPGVYTKN